ncbi:MAG: hypothetical protein AAGC46_15130 [Solirubrobacteraceae bacterium]|nr:hypothetical protein [Patulibacter sp.]
MAFFDDDPPTQQRRSSGPPPPPRPPRRPGTDRQDILRRQLTAGGGLVVLLAFIAFGLHSCVSSAHLNAAKNYDQTVNDLGTRSVSNVSQALEVLTKTSQDPIAQSQSISDLASDSAKLTEEARKLKTPGGLEGATQNLATSLSLRATALKRISELLGKAKGNSESASETATQSIAGQMEALLASDVLWQLRVTPFIKEKFQDLNLSTDSISSSVVLKDATWLNTATVSNRIGGQTPDTAAADPTITCTADVAHGHAIASVLANGKTLNSGTGVINQVPAASGTSFTVNVANQGDADESNVSIIVSGKPQGGGSGFSTTKKLAVSPQGKTTPVVVNLTKAISNSYTISVEIKKVQCEKTLDNNKATYSVIFGS